MDSSKFDTNSSASGAVNVRFMTMFMLLCMLAVNISQCLPNHRNGIPLHPLLTKPDVHKNNISVIPCFQDYAKMQMCVHCSQKTKSDLAFGLCCSDKLDIDCKFNHENVSSAPTLCVFDKKKFELCFQCSVRARSDHAFSDCCSNESGVQDWCRKYLRFKS